MSRKPKLALFLSGTGSNMVAIAKACQSGELNADVGVVFSNNADAPGIQKAKDLGLETLVIPHYKPRERFDTKVISSLEYFEVDWVILCGYMRILSPVFLSIYQGRILNIHPSLLPKYPGTRAIERAYENGDKVVGVTIHHVDEGVDTGDIILQESIEVLPGESLEALTQRIHKLEHSMYTKAIAKVIA